MTINFLTPFFFFLLKILHAFENIFSGGQMFLRSAVLKKIIQYAFKYSSLYYISINFEGKFVKVSPRHRLLLPRTFSHCFLG